MKATLIQAVNSALKLEMRKNSDIVLLGEDIGINGGVFRATEGLYDEFGPHRVIDTPLAESGIIGLAIGMSLYGLRPVAEIQFFDFIFPAFDQITSELAKMRYRSGGTYSAPMVIRAPIGAGVKGGPYHSQSGESYFVHTAGLKVIMPSTPYDTKGLLIAAMRDNDPVLFFEPKRIYRAFKDDIPDDDYTVPIGKANILQEGNDVTLVSYGATMVPAKEATTLAAQENISVELIDLRTLAPLDVEAIINSARKTGRVVIAHEAPKTLGMGAEISAMISEKAIEYLQAPILRVAGLDAPVPYSLESAYLPNAKRILTSIKKVASYK
ncbi:MAG: alpha-ketoacid dehydrogenase subunit beta [Thaumarchaeota archaeon]|nr:alpha-ketoacid dehydrogenase subunit beta [Nitrososphaerota archaeon]